MKKVGTLLSNVGILQRYLLDKQNGEWFGEASREGKPRLNYYKVGPWKCPYHNGRACMELISRIDSEGSAGGVD